MQDSYMLGMHVQTGEPISEIAHIRQSLRDILTTPVGSRLMRRDYGCNLMSLLDRPMNTKFISDVQVAVSMAITHLNQEYS